MPDQHVLSRAHSCSSVLAVVWNSSIHVLQEKKLRLSAEQQHSIILKYILVVVVKFSCYFFFDYRMSPVKVPN